MSGGEALAVLGAISAIISIIDASKKVYNAAKDTKGLHPAFREVAGRLPIVESILESAKQNIDERKVNDDSCKGVKHVAEACEEKVKTLDDLFHKAIPADGASDLKRYYKAVKALGRGNEVEKLMKGILEDVQLLACERGMNTATYDQEQEIVKAISDVSAISPSVPENEFQETGFTNTNYGSGTQYNAKGKNINQGNARQYNLTGGGSMNFVTNNDNSTQNIFNSRPNEDEAQACLRALFLTDPRDDRAKLISTKGLRVDGTCQWIKSHTLYNSWLCSPSQLLFLSGGPGKGKTMLSIFLAEELERDKKKLFLQYFCDNKDEKRNTAVAVLRGLIWQLLQLRPKLFDHILPDFKIQKTSLFSLETLWRIFERMLCDPTLEVTYCVLDGVDECDTASLEILLGKFTTLLSPKTDKSSSCHLNLLIVSRELPDLIPKLLSRFPCISLDKDENSQDIEIFIKAKVKELSEQEHYSEVLRIHVDRVFRKRAQGTFLWIGIVAQALKKYKATEVEDALEKFPPGLDELYARILLQIDSGRREIAARILRWVVMAVRPLTVLELSFAIEPTVNSSIVANRGERIRDQISYCGDFLEIKDYRDYRPDEEDEEDEEDEGYREDAEDAEGEMEEWDWAGLIHQSAKDYLLRKNQDSNPVLEYFRVKEHVANLEIARRCLEYMQSGALEHPGPHVLRSASHLSPPPLALYAVRHWHEHARFLDCSEDVFDLSRPFYHKKSQIRTSWLEAFGDSGWPYGGELPKSFPLLHLASCFGLLPLVQNLVLKKGWINKIKRLSFLNKIDSQRMTALMWAAQCGHEAVVRLLLEKGANTKMKDKNRSMALHLAADFGHEAIAQRLLLEKGVNINARDFRGETILSKAAEHGYEAVIHLILRKRVDIEVRDYFGGTALMKAISSGQKAIAQLLLEKGANIEAQDYRGQTALMKAAKAKQKAIAKLLLEKGANIETQDYRGDTAVMIFAGYGQKAIVQLLLEKGANIDAQDYFGSTALAKAAEHGYKAGIQLLLEKGADTEVEDSYGETALALAVRYEHHDVVPLLVANGANVNVKDLNGRTALMWAAVYGNEDIIRLLLQHGADTEAVNEGETALAIAARKREEAEDEGFSRSFSDDYSESQLKHLIEERKSRLDSIIQMLTFHSQTQSST